MQPEKPADSVVTCVGTFIRQELAYGDELQFDEDSDLIERGVIDSMSLLRLVGFLEEQYHIAIRDEDIVPGNFRSTRAIEAYVTRCKDATQ